MKRLAILGSTGSIGRSTVSVLRSHPESFRVAALAAHPAAVLDQVLSLDHEPVAVREALEDLHLVPFVKPCAHPPLPHHLAVEDKDVVLGSPVLSGLVIVDVALSYTQETPSAPDDDKKN